MSKAFQSSFQSSPSSSWIGQSSTVPTFPSASSSTPLAAPLAGRYPYGGSGIWKPPANWSLASNAQLPATKKLLKAKLRTSEEEAITKRVGARVAARLALDHASVINPDTESPFSNTVDVVNRLLPYHVFHQPNEDADRKGKRKADDLVTEIEETAFALECFRRKRSLEERFRRVKTRSGKRPAPDDQAVALAQAVLEAERSETALINAEIRAARADLDRLQREKRIHDPRLQAPPVPQPQYYRNPYAYTQHTYNQAAGFPVPPTPGGTSLPQYSINTAIPVQMPVSSLPALHALGIQPVAATSLAPGAAQPPAVLRGSSADGTVVNLEINVSLLQAAQVNGLALVLNSLMSGGIDHRLFGNSSTNT
ncbi:hypothetical protein B0H15DRAFT_398490 [Mycena belliarum]|uniref:GLTSCR protein conserved domain-containing protein n=1 Tax=Mycena belliarum TaxID=1033014 RepID=A0AAD6U089_9AGAR|nr:hypothetical protein B0H15DRAFT_398490 [Mycena belliae]